MEMLIAFHGHCVGVPGQCYLHQRAVVFAKGDPGESILQLIRGLSGIDWTSHACSLRELLKLGSFQYGDSRDQHG